MILLSVSSFKYAIQISFCAPNTTNPPHFIIVSVPLCNSLKFNKPWHFINYTSWRNLKKKKKESFDSQVLSFNEHFMKYPLSKGHHFSWLTSMWNVECSPQFSSSAFSLAMMENLSRKRTNNQHNWSCCLHSINSSKTSYFWQHTSSSLILTLIKVRALSLMGCMVF